VIPTDVAHKDGHWRSAVERRVGSLVIVETDPARKGGEAFVVGTVEGAVRPLTDERLDEALGSAVGLGPVRSDARRSLG
jgi:hypothetical protein